MKNKNPDPIEPDFRSTAVAILLLLLIPAFLFGRHAFPDNEQPPITASERDGVTLEIARACIEAVETDYPEYKNDRLECTKAASWNNDCFCRIYRQDKREKSYTEKEISTLEFNLNSK